jgi:hypothetical protein
MQGTRWLFVGENGARLSTQFARRSREVRMRLPALYRGRCMVRVHCLACVAYWNEQRALGFAEGPFAAMSTSGGGPFKTEMVAVRSSSRPSTSRMLGGSRLPAALCTRGSILRTASRRYADHIATTPRPCRNCARPRNANRPSAFRTNRS